MSFFEGPHPTATTSSAPEKGTYASPYVFNFHSTASANVLSFVNRQVQTLSEMKLAFAPMALLVIAAVFAAREWTQKQTNLYAPLKPMI